MKTLLSIVLVSLALVGCKRAEPYDPNVYATDADIEAQTAKCKGLNGTLRGSRQDRGPHMGEWYGLFCDFETPPAKTESTESESTTEFQ